jgi:flagellar basal-body rod protein FlgB
MIDGIDNSFRFQGAALQLRAQRQQVLAANIANADTPNYKAVDFDFTKALERATANDSAPGPRAARAAGPVEVALAPRASQAGLDGNTVDMDIERNKFVDNAVRYEAALKFLNGKIRALLSAMQG